MNAIINLRHFRIFGLASLELVLTIDLILIFYCIRSYFLCFNVKRVKGSNIKTMNDINNLIIISSLFHFFVFLQYYLRFSGFFELILFVSIFCFPIILNTKNLSKTISTIVKYIIFSFIIIILVHYYFNVNTQLNYQLSLSKCPPNFNSLFGIFDC